MPTIRLSKRSVELAPVAERDTFIWDPDTRGFGLKITPAGKKIYLIQYRMGGRGSATRRYTIGPHGTWNPQSARQEAERLLRLTATGTDPHVEAKERERADRDLSFTAYAERFLEEYGKRRWRPRNYASAVSNMRRWISPNLGRKALPAIGKRDVIDILDKVPPHSPALPRALFALIRKLFNWAVEHGDLDRSPLDGMRSPPTAPARDRVLTDEELWFVVLCAGDLTPPFGAMVRLLVLTGQRREEVAQMRWSELDQKLCEWIIPGARTKNGEQHTVPLSEIACKELNDLAAGERWPRIGYVFTTNNRTPISGFSKAKLRLDAIVETAMKRPLTPWRLHDIRRTFATNMQRLGVRFEVTEALLNHLSGSRSGVAGVYQRHEWAAEKREAIRLWNDRLAELISNEGMDRFVGSPSPSTEG